MISGEWFQSEWDSSLEVDLDLMKDVVAIVDDEEEQVTTADEEPAQKDRRSV
jgi:hypothetical protein